MSTPPPSRLGAPQRRVAKPVTGLLIERVLRRAMAVICIAFGVQALPLVGEQEILPPAWKVPLVIVIYGALAAIAVLGFLGRDFRVLAQILTAAFLIVLAAWPVTAIQPDLVADRAPWFWYVSDLAMTAAVFAYTAWITAAYVVVVSALYFVVRQSPPGGGADAGSAAVESVHALLVGAIVLILVRVLRRAARSVDRAQGAAIQRYSDAVRQHAVEVERVEVDAIVHDGVLTALLVAAKADTCPARAQAAELADLSMRRLQEALTAGQVDQHPVSLRTLQDRLRLEIARLDPRATITPQAQVPSMVLPADVAETLFSAATQALVNSCQHAGADVQRSVRIRVIETVAEIVVADDGAGFDTSVPSERLGVRVSILERVKNAGGVAMIRSRIGVGTAVTLRWTSRTDALVGLRA